MKLGVCAWSFEALPIDGALGICASMGFKAVALSAFRERGSASYEPDQLGTDPARFVAQARPLLERHGVYPVDLFVQFGASFGDRSLNDPDPAVRQKNIDMFKGIIQFCTQLNIPVVTFIPGIEHLGAPWEQSLDRSAETFRALVKIGADAGIQVCFEPHMQSVTATPEDALALIERAPGLKATLDYSHFILQYIEPERIHKLIPHTGHVHIRPARYGKLQTRHAEGTIDFVDIIGRLKAANYTGVLALEYVCGGWFDVNQLDTLTETMVTKRALEPHVPVA